jgi:hypothetical protein
MVQLQELLKIYMHHCKNRTIKHVTKLKIYGDVIYMNDVGYHTFDDEVTVDPLSSALRTRE